MNQQELIAALKGRRYKACAAARDAEPGRAVPVAAIEASIVSAEDFERACEVFAGHRGNMRASLREALQAIGLEVQE